MQNTKLRAAHQRDNCCCLARESYFGPDQTWCGSPAPPLRGLSVELQRWTFSVQNKHTTACGNVQFFCSRAVAPQSQSRLPHKLWADVPLASNVRGLHTMVSSGPPKSLLPEVLRVSDRTFAKDAKVQVASGGRCPEAFVCQRHLLLPEHVQSFEGNTACVVSSA